MPAQTRIIHYYVCLGAAGGKEWKVNMKYYDLPKTDLKVSEIALGCMRIADKSIEEVEELVKTALDCGINFFDHADIYGGGKSEEL